MRSETLEKNKSISIFPEKVTVALEGWNATDLQSREIFERSLRSLMNQTFPIRQCEFFVIMEEGLDPAGYSWIQEMLPEIQFIRLHNATYYRIKNTAIQSAHGDYLILADSDVVYEPQWLKSMLAPLQEGKDLVTGKTQYHPGFLSTTLNLCDWAATREESGYTNWFYCNNLGMPRHIFETIHFREDIGPNGMGSVNLVRYELIQRGIQFWFSANARGWHHLWPFFKDRLSYGGYQIHFRKAAPNSPWSWLLKIPFIGPFFVIGGALLKAWLRAWQSRSSLPAYGLSLPIYILTISFVKAVELMGALMVAWTPKWVDRRFGWFSIAAADTHQ